MSPTLCEANSLHFMILVTTLLVGLVPLDIIMQVFLDGIKEISRTLLNDLFAVNCMAFFSISAHPVATNQSTFLIRLR